LIKKNRFTLKKILKDNDNFFLNRELVY
jgi:hypothetical protein